MGGVGKTEMALRYVYEMRDNYRSIFWISGVNQATLFAGLEQIRAETNCIPELSELSKTAKFVIKWLEEQVGWLLIIDNLDDISVINGFLPSMGCNDHTLITTRNPTTEGIPAQGIEVEVLDIDTAVRLFRVLLNSRGKREVSDDDSEIRNIVKELGFLPLAIEQAAAFIRESKRSVDEYLPLYRESQSTKQKLQNFIPKGNRKYQYSVASTVLRLRQVQPKCTSCSRITRAVSFPKS